MEIQPWGWLEVLVTPWPINYEESWTLAETVTRRGVGLHSGKVSEVQLGPSQNHGFFVSFEGSNEPPTRLNIDQVRESQLCTSLQIGPHRLSTVEHLLAALAGCGLTHVSIKVSGEEIPLLDGSALLWVEAIKEAGFVKVEKSSPHKFEVSSSFVLNRGNSIISLIPADCLKLIGIIDFPYRAIGKQILELDLTPEVFVKEIAPARTFGFVDQVEQLKKEGLIKGGGLKNALVCDGKSWLNPPLRFKDEPIRHKLLDLIGDLSLVGLPKAQILVYRGSHALHADLALSLQQNRSTD